MTKKDYIAIAAILADNRGKADRGGWESHAAAKAWAVAVTAVTLDIADALAADNPRFDRARFLAACGVTA